MDQRRDSHAADLPVRWRGVGCSRGTGAYQRREAMAVITRTQGTSRSNAAGYPAALINHSDVIAPLSISPRNVGHSASRNHVSHIVFPEKYHERYRLPIGIEQQSF